MKVLIATDSFPPGCGGSGWSTYELARGLRARGHELTIVQPRPGHPDGVREYDGFVVREFGVFAPAVPFARNYLKNERLYARFGAALGRIIADTGAHVVHGQHVMSIPAAVDAAAAAGIPSVATVRDYWPVCYWSDLIHDPSAETLCPACSTSGMLRCIRPRASRAWPLAVPLVPYMQANLARKQAALARADRVIAVSSTMARDLAARTTGLDPRRLLTIPNPVDVETIRATAQAHRPTREHPFALYVGKLAPNKGTRHLMTAVDRAGLRWPLVVIGDGPDRPMVERWIRETGRDATLTGWLSREETLGWLAAASLLVFPSQGPESLSRVLLEASALAIPIAAMDTGGTRDIIIPGRTGLLSPDAAGLGDAVARLVADRDLARRLGLAAAAHVEAHFAAGRVVERIEAVYDEVTSGHA
jgi:glycosyltransferase involved in cell wall biosynthesis